MSETPPVVEPAKIPVRPFTASADIDQLAAALVAAQAEYPVVDKSKTAEVATRTGSKYTYDYADLAAILVVMRPVLTKHGLAVLQPPSVIVDRSVTISTIILHTSGQWFCDRLTLPVIDITDPQKVGSAISYARRYAYCGATGMTPEDEDDDGQKAGTPSREASRAAKRQTRGETAASGSGDELITTKNPDGTPGGQRGRLVQIVNEHKINKTEFGEYIKTQYGYGGWAEIKRKDYDAIVAAAQNWAGALAAVRTAEREPGYEG